MLNKLSRLLDEAGISLTDHQKNQLVAYVDMLNKWNKAYNLTSVRDPNEMLIRHILDSIVVAIPQRRALYRRRHRPGFAGDPLVYCSPGEPFHAAGQPWPARTFLTPGSARAEA